MFLNQLKMSIVVYTGNCYRYISIDAPDLIEWLTMLLGGELILYVAMAVTADIMEVLMSLL